MKTLSSAFSLAAALIFAGCGEPPKSTPPVAEKEKVGENPLNAGSDYLGAVVKAQQSAVKTVDIASITQAIQMFEANEGRHPKSLDELVEKGMLKKIPTAPNGKKIVYDATTGTVKIVAQ